MDIRTLAYSPDSSLLATGCYESGTITLWDTTAGEVVGTFFLHGEGSAEDVCFSPDGELIASTGYDRTIKLWSVRDLRQVDSFRLPQEGWALAWSPDGRYLACGGRFPEVLLWDVSRREIRLRMDAQSNTQDVAFSPNGETLASAHDDASIHLWDVRSGAPQAHLQGHAGVVGGIAFSPCGQTIASASSDGTVRLWSVPLGREFGVVERRAGGASSVAFAPDGRSLVAGYDSILDDGPGVLLWDIGPAASSAP